MKKHLAKRRAGEGITYCFCKAVVWDRDTTGNIKLATCQTCIKQALKHGNGS